MFYFDEMIYTPLTEERYVVQIVLTVKIAQIHESQFNQVQLFNCSGNYGSMVADNIVR